MVAEAITRRLGCLGQVEQRALGYAIANLVPLPIWPR